MGTATLDPAGTATFTPRPCRPDRRDHRGLRGRHDQRDSNSQMFPETVNADTIASLIALTGQDVQGSAAFGKLPPQAQAGVTKLINAATTYLTQYNPQLNAKQKAALVSGYDLAIVVLQKAGT